MCGYCGCNKNEGSSSQQNQCCQNDLSGGGNQCHVEYKKAYNVQEEKDPCIGDYEKHLFEKQEGDACDYNPKEPYRIPGYAGHVPTLQSRSGGTYGNETHEVLTSGGVDPKPSSFGQNIHVCPVPLHEPYHIPGYTGHVPGLKQLVGGSYGQDTHKLLFSVKSHPTREENLSPYRPAQDSYFRTTNNVDGHFNNGTHFQQESFTQSSYKRPDEYFDHPQYKYRIADTYATTADLTLVDPCVNEESKVIVSTRELDDTQVTRVHNSLEERTQDLPYINQPMRHRPTVPGFDTFIDALRGARGQRFEFTNQSPSHKQLQQQLILQRGKPKEHSRFNQITDVHGQSYSQTGSGDDLPYGYSKYGKDRQRYTNSALYDFTSNYRRRQSTEWAPATISRPDPPAFDIPGEIYTQHTGLLPGYSAHVPGALFRCGKTFTDDSRDARKALKGDRF